MIEANETIGTDDQATLNTDSILETVTSGLGYTMIRDILVKPLAVTKVKRLVNSPTKTDEIDEEGQPIMEMIEKEVEVDSTFRTGIVIALPTGVDVNSAIELGSKIVYPHKYSIDFDLFKDSVLVKPYDIIGLAA